MAAPGMLLRSMFHPEGDEFPGITAFVRSSGAEIMVPLSPTGATSRSRSATSKVEFAAASTTRPSVAKAALLYAGVVFGKYAGCLSSRFWVKVSRVHPREP